MVPQLEQQTRKATHPAAADADEMHAARSGTQKVNQLLPINHTSPRVWRFVRWRH